MARAKCPICKRPIHDGAERDDGAKGAAGTERGKDAFPFCSTRCKLVDLGAWLDGTYRIAGEPIAEPDDEVLARLTSRDGGDA